MPGFGGFRLEDSALVFELAYLRNSGMCPDWQKVLRILTLLCLAQGVAVVAAARAPTAQRALSAQPAATCACPRSDPRYVSAGPYNLDLGGGALLFGGSVTQAVFDLFVTRTFGRHLKLGIGVGARGAADQFGVIAHVLLGWRFAFGDRVSLDLDWTVGYGAYWIGSATVAHPFWRDVVVLTPGAKVRWALSRRFELWIVPLGFQAVISMHAGYTASWFAPKVGVSMRWGAGG